MSKIPKDKRDKMIVVGIATVVASAALWFLLIKSQYNTLRLARAQAVIHHQPHIAVGGTACAEVIKDTSSGLAGVAARCGTAQATND